MSMHAIQTVRIALLSTQYDDVSLGWCKTLDRPDGVNFCTISHNLSTPGKRERLFFIISLYAERRLRDLEWSIIEPVAVDNIGAFVSHNLHYEVSSASTQHSLRTKRHTDSPSLPYPPDTIRYRLNIAGHTVNIQLEHNSKLYSDNLVIEKRFKNRTNDDDKSNLLSHCHFTGQIEGDSSSQVALSTCNGLVCIIYYTCNITMVVRIEMPSPLKYNVDVQGFWHLRYDNFHSNAPLLGNLYNQFL